MNPMAQPDSDALKGKQSLGLDVHGVPFEWAGNRIMTVHHHIV